MAKHKTQNPSEMQMLNLRIARETVHQLRKVAAAEERTVSQEVRRLIALRLAEASEPVRADEDVAA